jgi:hypothetical protein
MKDCPTCGSVVDGPYCLKCAAGKPAAPSKGHDQNWWRCADTDAQGNRCSKPGTLTESTRGSDRWYCHQHFPMFRGRGYGSVRTPPPTGWANAVRRPTARPVCLIAEELLEREAIQNEPANEAF